MKPVKVATLVSMYVHPMYRRAQIGGRLVAEFARWAKGAGADEAEVTAYSSNGPGAGEAAGGGSGLDDRAVAGEPVCRSGLVGSGSVMTDREMLAQTVALIEPADALEVEHQDAVLDWIKSGAGLYRLVPPDQPPMHLVSYFVPFDERTGSLLLTEHRKSGLVLPPGGHCEFSEGPWQTVQRECVEELGVSAAALPWIGTEPLFVTVTETQGTVVRRHTDVSLWHVIDMACTDHRMRLNPGEFDSACWMSFDELLSHSGDRFDPHMHRFARKLRARHRSSRC